MNNKTQQTNSPAYREAIKAIAVLEQQGFEAKLAGGCVRDRLLGLDPKDFDIATTALPDEVIKTFTKRGIQTVPTGIDHGTITAVMGKTNIEITTLRVDAETFGRKAKVAFGNLSFEQDAARRDFTINALYEDKDGKIYDYHGGEKDLAAKVLRFVGNAKERIEEDYLRILRFYRFWARFNFTADAEARAAVALHKDGLKNISQERITSELVTMLAYNPIETQLNEMSDNGILAMVLPEARLDQTTKKRVMGCARIAQKDRAIARLAFLHGSAGDDKSIERIAKQLRLPNHTLTLWQQLLKSCESAQSSAGADTASVMHLIDDCERAGGEGSLTELFIPFWQIMSGDEALTTRIANTESKKKSLRKSPLPINGQDIMVCTGISAGPKIGEILESLKRSYRNEQWCDKQDGLALAKSIASSKT